MQTNNRTNYMKLAYRYTRALSRWIKAGRPARNEEEILGIFTTYCQECECFEPDRGRCNSCGCHVGTVRSPLLNKIAMVTENCPEGKW